MGNRAVSGHVSWQPDSLKPCLAAQVRPAIALLELGIYLPIENHSFLLTLMIAQKKENGCCHSNNLFIFMDFLNVLLIYVI
jgi:hypothetical protein